MTVLGLSCSKWNPSSLTRDWTQGPWIRSMESWPLDHQGSLSTVHFNALWGIPLWTQDWEPLSHFFSFVSSKVSLAPFERPCCLVSTFSHSVIYLFSHRSLTGYQWLFGTLGISKKQDWCFTSSCSFSPAESESESRSDIPPTLFDTMDYTVHGILQSRMLEWVAFPPPGNLPNPGIEPRSPALQVDSLPAEPQGKPKNTGVASLSLL